MIHLLLNMFQDVLDCILFLSGLPCLENALRDVKQPRLVALLSLQLQEISQREHESQLNGLLSLHLTL